MAATAIDKVQYLQIGVQGENIAMNIEFDMTAWAEQYPDATFHILFKPYNETEVSPQISTYDDATKKLTWTVGYGATAVVGVGYTEVRAQDGEGLIKKTRVIPTAVESSVSGVEVNPPAAYADWVTNVLNAGAAIIALAHGTAINFSIGTNGHLVYSYTNEDEETVTVDLGPVDAYGMAVEAGYPRTREQFVDELANTKTYCDTAEAAAEAAEVAKVYAQTFMGAPRAAASAAAMEDTSLIYVYTGTTGGGLTNGKWYYHNGTAWAEGGTYNSTALQTDITLLVSGAAADSKVTGDKISELKSALYDYNVDDPIKNDKVCTGATLRNVTFAWNADKNVCTMNSDTGASSGFSYNVILSNSSSLCGLKAGEKYYFDISVSKTGINAELYWYVNGTLGSATYYNTSTWVTVPSNATGILLRAFVYASAGSLTNDYLKIMVYTSVPSKQMYDRTVQIAEAIDKRIYSKPANPYVSDSSLAFSDIKEDGFYLIDTTWTVTDKPNDTFSIMGLTVENLSVPKHGIGWIKQIVEEIDTVRKYKKYIRFSNNAGTFGNWIAENAYTLYPTGDSTDRTSDIHAALNAFGTCRLEPGEYYIANVVMPENTSIIGSGIGRTVLKQINTATGSAIKPWTRCSVSDLTLLGNQYDSSGNRVGIGWVGTYESAESPGSTPSNGILNNLYIDGFDGAGIVCRKTSMRVDSGLTASNIVIKNCGNGIMVQQYAEFNQFTNVQATNCTGYGVICNGGNNVFTNCNFSMNYRSLWMNDSQGSPAPNNSHGSFVGCIFDHSGNNDGYAMILYGLDSGEMFVGCQIFYGKTQIENCVGIRFVGCNFGRKTNINIVNSSAIGYSGCMFRSTGSTDTPVTVSTSTGVKFTDCLQYDGSDFNPSI